MTPDERRAAILRATVPLLSERGINVTTRELAEASGVAEGTLFRVFPDKSALLRAAVEQALDPAPVVSELAAIPLVADPRVAITKAVRIVLGRSRDVAGLLVALHQLDEGDGPPLEAGSERHLPGFRPGPHGMHGPRGMHGMHGMKGAQGPHGGTAAHPFELIGKALASLLEPYRSRLRRDPAVCARLLIAVILTSSRPILAGPDPTLTEEDIVELFLDGALTTPES